MEFKPNIAEVVERYRKLWRFEELDPPIVNIHAPEMGITTGSHDCEFWEDPEGFVESHQEAFAARRDIPDDAVPMLRPPFSHSAVPWVLGAQPELHAGKLWVRPVLEDIAAFDSLQLEEESPGLEKVEDYYKKLIELADGRFAVGLSEVPGPTDLMGALHGFEAMLYELYDNQDTVRAFARRCADLAIAFNDRIRRLVGEQKTYGGSWAGSAWVPEGTIYFCEHVSVNYSPGLYETLIRPANDHLLDQFDAALTYVYTLEGRHLLDHYFDRGRPVWIRTCSPEVITPDLAERYRGKAIVSVTVKADDFPELHTRMGGVGVSYNVVCESQQEVRDLCNSLGGV